MTVPERLRDPDEHFPYKHDEVSALVAENPPMGPHGDDDDGSVRAEDYMTQEIADASKAYIEAQADYLTNPGDGTRAAFEAAKRSLVAARQAHREHRTAPVVVGIRSRRAGE